MNGFTMSNDFFQNDESKSSCYAFAKTIVKRLTGCAMNDPRDAEGRLIREAARLRREENRQLLASAPRRYGLAIVLVAVSFAYCDQWRDLIHLPAGSPSAFIVAVALAIRWGGIGPGWLAFALSLLCMWIGFYEPHSPFEISRFCWFMIALLTPLVAIKSGPTARRGMIRRSVSLRARDHRVPHKFEPRARHVRGLGRIGSG